MTANREILTALLREASRQSEPFQSLIHDYSADVMNDSEVHHLFTARLDANVPMRREIEILKASLRVPAAGPLSPAMNEVLAAADALPAGSHASLCEIADLVAVELVYKLREMTPARWRRFGLDRDHLRNCGDTNADLPVRGHVAIKDHSSRQGEMHLAVSYPSG